MVFWSFKFSTLFHLLKHFSNFYLDLEEAKVLLPNLGFVLGTESIEENFAKYDTNSDGEMDKQEIKDLMQDKLFGKDSSFRLNI